MGLEPSTREIAVERGLGEGSPRSAASCARCGARRSPEARRPVVIRDLPVPSRERFQCSKCGTRGYVETLVRCSCCGQQDTWGFQPTRK